jgi:hypothetical protein
MTKHVGIAYAHMSTRWYRLYRLGSEQLSIKPVSLTIAYGPLPRVDIRVMSILLTTQKRNKNHLFLFPLFKEGKRYKRYGLVDCVL